jgi:hypothetical protein
MMFFKFQNFYVLKSISGALFENCLFTSLKTTDTSPSKKDNLGSPQIQTPGLFLGSPAN